MGRERARREGLGRHDTFVGRFAGAGARDTLPAYDLVQWGGFLQQSGLPAGALLGQQLNFGRVVYTYRLVEQQMLDGAFAGFSVEGGRMSKTLLPDQGNGFVTSGAIFLGIDSPIGPFYLAWGRSSDGAKSAYVFLGRP